MSTVDNTVIAGAAEVATPVVSAIQGRVIEKYKGKGYITKLDNPKGNKYFAYTEGNDHPAEFDALGRARIALGLPAQPVPKKPIPLTPKRENTNNKQPKGK